MTRKFNGLSSVSTVALAGLFLFTTSIPVIASSNCENLNGCEKKFCEIEKQLKISQEKGNEHKADGLRRALNNSKENCSDKALKDDLIKEIRDEKKEIVEHESDLKEAEQYQEIDKVRKYLNKIEEKEVKINRLEDEISELE